MGRTGNLRDYMADIALSNVRNSGSEGIKLDTLFSKLNLTAITLFDYEGEILGVLNESNGFELSMVGGTINWFEFNFKDATIKIIHDTIYLGERLILLDKIVSIPTPVYTDGIPTFKIMLGEEIIGSYTTSFIPE